MLSNMYQNNDSRTSESSKLASSTSESGLMVNEGRNESIAEATAPRHGISEKRYKDRTLDYHSLLPYETESESQADVWLQRIINELYTSIKGHDFRPGALQLTKQLSSWLQLKHEMSRNKRAKLVKLYYWLSLKPGLNHTCSNSFCEMFKTLTKESHYLEPEKDLLLDWKPLWQQMKARNFYDDQASFPTGNVISTTCIERICAHARLYFDPAQRYAILEEILPFFKADTVSSALVVVDVLTALFPTRPAPVDMHASRTDSMFPTFFHLWALMGKSMDSDFLFIKLFSRFSSDHLCSLDTNFGRHGIFTENQSNIIFTAIQGLFGDTSRSNSLDDSRVIARLIVHSVAPACDGDDCSILTSLEGLLNHVQQLSPLTQREGRLIRYLTTEFVSRCNREKSGELRTPQSRKIDDELERRFVSLLKEVTFRGLHSSDEGVCDDHCIALQMLAYLDPDLVLPSALQRFYASFQRIHEISTIIPTLKALKMLVPIMCKLKGYRCHMTTLLDLAIRGIDANDPIVAHHTLCFIRNFAYSIPMVTLTEAGNCIHDNMLATEWVQDQRNRMEHEGSNMSLNYNEMSDQIEAKILRSSTFAFKQIISKLMDGVFMLLDNLPTAGHIRESTHENGVRSVLQPALSTLFASLSPELFDTALEKVVEFTTNRGILEARDEMAYILNALCKVNPEKALKVFVPTLISNIRSEITLNGAASGNGNETNCLPRDQALARYIKLLNSAVDFVGCEVLQYKNEQLDLINHLQDTCQGPCSLLASRYVADLLLNLTSTYSLDHTLYEPQTMKRGLDADDWGKTTEPADLTIRWHQPSSAEISFAVELVVSQTNFLKEKMGRYISNPQRASRYHEFPRLINHSQWIISSVASLIDLKQVVGPQADEFPSIEFYEDAELLVPLGYADGYALRLGDPDYRKLHQCREDIGSLILKCHKFLSKSQNTDPTSHVALCYATVAWAVDVGITRTTPLFQYHHGIYENDTYDFFIPGLRKPYPRPLLVKRMEVYQLDRRNNNTAARRMTELDKQLVNHLANCIFSLYGDVQVAAQLTLNKMAAHFIGGKEKAASAFLRHFKQALEDGVEGRIEAGLCAFARWPNLFARTVMLNWGLASEAIRLYIDAAGIDKPKIQMLVELAFENLAEFGKLLEHPTLADDEVVEEIKPPEDVSFAIRSRRKLTQQRQKEVEESQASLGLELTRRSKSANQTTAHLCLVFATNLCLRFSTTPPREFVHLVISGTNNPVPYLRVHYLQAFTVVLFKMREQALCGYRYHNYLFGQHVNDKNRSEVLVRKGDGNFTDDFLEAFKKSETPLYMVDAGYPGWLVWGKKFTSYKAEPLSFNSYDEEATSLLDDIGQRLDHKWLSDLFNHLEQEEPNSCRSDCLDLLVHVFYLMHEGKTGISLEDVKELTEMVFGDGNDNDRHRVASKIVGALVKSCHDQPLSTQDRVYEYAAPFILKVVTNNLSPGNLESWLGCLDVITVDRDPRRCYRIVDSLKTLRLGKKHNSIFTDQSTIKLLELLFNNFGWHFEPRQQILDNLLKHMNNPHPTVCQEIGRLLSEIHRTQYHESFESVSKLLEINKNTSDTGILPYKPTQQFKATMKQVFDQLKEWRISQDSESYKSGSRTVLTWLDCTLRSHMCTQLVPFLATPIMEELSHMMDVEGDVEFHILPLDLFMRLPYIPFPCGQVSAFVKTLIELSSMKASWRQRAYALANMGTVSAMSPFLTRADERTALLRAVSEKLVDKAPEVRQVARLVLVSMIGRLPRRIRDPIITHIKGECTRKLKIKPMSRQQRHADGAETIPGIEHHAAVLELGALVTASVRDDAPLPNWIGEIVELLSKYAAANRGMAARDAGIIVGNFKSSRQASWVDDKKNFTEEQLMYMEGVSSMRHYS
ncbi:hypothetical protein FOMG_16888 [Fusarium oxysporum f. sp. melonis 26406]|uniref:Proteasome activator subunit 4 n=2 Tax=Fusarium oxysporum f. sp. melonis 26406 TaxID=1089452 RepID=W9Z466_FUSOX|nr:hypothetical protein FOMG_16888 [Fusarium oxysporum f. sp. melonis 26406]